MEPYELEDNFGQKTMFTGELLAAIDTYREDKPTWFDLQVYRTTGGNFVTYQIRYSNVSHADRDCSRINSALGPVCADTESHLIACNKCGPGDWASDDEIKIGIHKTARELCRHLTEAGANRIIRSFLADLSDVDPDVAEAWLVVEVD